MKNCSFCKKKINPIYTLKHLYYYCKNCNFYFRDKFNNKNIFNFIFNNKHYLNNNNTNKQTHFTYYKNLLNNYLKNLSNNKTWSVAFNKEKFNYFRKKRFKRPLKVLDVGGSPGIDAVHMLKKKKIQKIDITEYNKDIAKHIFKKTKINVYNFDLMKLKIINKKQYDLIILWNVIYYCKDLDKLFKIIKKNLNPGGVIILCSPVPTLGLVIKFGIIESYPPNFFYSIKSIKRSLSKNNLKIDKVIFSQNKNFIKHNFFNFKNLYFFKKNFFLIIVSCYYIIRNLFSIFTNKKNLNLQNYILECKVK